MDHSLQVLRKFQSSEVKKKISDRIIILTCTFYRIMVYNIDIPVSTIKVFDLRTFSSTFYILPEYNEIDLKMTYNPCQCDNVCMELASFEHVQR
jgi:hypothetical protein